MNLKKIHFGIRIKLRRDVHKFFLSFSNLSSQELRKGLKPVRKRAGIILRSALHCLANNDCVVIEMADKEGTIVIMNKNEYTSACEKNLSDRTSDE